MSINKHNYEAFFLDYHEGNLSPQEVADLLLFVEQHPELKEEFESFENVTLDELSAIPFENKSILKKEITLDNKEEYFIRAVENTLTPAENNLLENFVKQHPQFLPELELFKKTKVFADTSVIFENKESLKRIAVTTDDLLIASVEGLLSKQETALLNQQIAVDAEMQHNYGLYKQTKLVADASIVYEDKEELKRKERKIIPFYYYASAIAAGMLLLFGLFFLFNNKTDKGENLADKTDTSIKTQVSGQKEKEIEKQEKNIAETNTSIKTTSKNKKQNTVAFKKDNIIVIPNIKEEQPIANNIENTPQPIENKELPKNNVTLSVVEGQQPITNNQTLASNQKPATNVTQSVVEGQQSSEFLSLRELAAKKFKEKTLDDETMAMQKKNGRAKRFTGWDLAQIVTKGISKVTGRDLEVKPTYNDEGVVTAYALGNSLQRTTGR